MKYTPNAQQALANAKRNAASGKRGLVGTKELILAIIDLPESTACSVLTKLTKREAPLAAIKGEMEKLLKTGTETDTAELVFSSGVLRVLDLADKARGDLQQEYVGTEHILLGFVMGENDNPVARFLTMALGLTAEGILQELARISAPGSDAKVVSEEQKLLANRQEVARDTLCEVVEIGKGHAKVEFEQITSIRAEVPLLGMEIELTPRIAACLKAVNFIPRDKREMALVELLTSLQPKSKE